MNRDLHHYRKSYEHGELLLTTTNSDPIRQFSIWFEEVETEGGIEEPNAMTLATIGIDGLPKSRIVLLKGFDKEGFKFYTNYQSEKGKSMEKNPRVSLSFFWPTMERQVIIQGEVSKLDSKDSDKYFHSRPIESQLGALVSDQSRVIKNRQVLEDKMNLFKATYADKPIPRPSHWGGYIVKPMIMEFWQGRPSRLHDRIRYHVTNGNWIKERLAP